MAFHVRKIREPLSAGNQRLLPETSKQTIFLPLHVFCRCLSSPTGQVSPCGRISASNGLHRIEYGSHKTQWLFPIRPNFYLRLPFLKMKSWVQPRKAAKKLTRWHISSRQKYSIGIFPNRLWRAIQLIIIETRMSWYLTPCSSYSCSKWTGNSYHKGAVSPKSRRTINNKQFNLTGARGIAHHTV